MAAHSSVLAWEIPWTEEPGGLQSTGSQKCQTHLSTKQQSHLQETFLKHKDRKSETKRMRNI